MGFQRRLARLCDSLATIQAVLADAERRQEGECGLPKAGPQSLVVEGQLQGRVACACFPAFVGWTAVMTSRYEALMSGRIDVMAEKNEGATGSVLVAANVNRPLLQMT